MGRHRPDPRGHARILVAAFAVVLALALLIVGAIALVGAMTSKPDGSGIGSSPVSASRAASSAQTSGSRPAAVHALLIRVTGPSAYVQVATSANTTVLQKGMLNHNESRVYDTPDLIVTVDPAQNVDVEIHGKSVSTDTTGKQTWTVGQG